VDEFTQGWIGPRNGAFTPKAAYYALQLFTQHFGQILVKTDQNSPVYEARSMGRVDAVGNVPYLEAVSSVDPTSQSASIIVINKHFDRSISTKIDFTGFSATAGTIYALTGTGVDANSGTQPPPNWPAQAVAVPDGRFYLGGPGEISFTTQAITVDGSSLIYVAPPDSVTALVFSGSFQ
jgi:hypothetical protein